MLGLSPLQAPGAGGLGTYSHPPLGRGLWGRGRSALGARQSQLSAKEQDLGPALPGPAWS